MVAFTGDDGGVERCVVLWFFGSHCKSGIPFVRCKFFVASSEIQSAQPERQTSGWLFTHGNEGQLPKTEVHRSQKCKINAYLEVRSMARGRLTDRLTLATHAGAITCPRITVHVARSTTSVAYLDTLEGGRVEHSDRNRCFGISNISAMDERRSATRQNAVITPCHMCPWGSKWWICE